MCNSPGWEMGQGQNLLIMFQGNSDINNFGQCLKEETPGVKKVSQEKSKNARGKNDESTVLVQREIMPDCV